MTSKESKELWEYIGMMKGYSNVLKELSKCLKNDIIKDIGNDMFIKTNNLINTLTESNNNQIIK